MRISWHFLSVLCAGLLLGLGALSCGGDSDSDGGGGGIKRTDTESLVTILTSDIATTLDPHATDDGGDSKILVQVFETLVRLDPQDVTKIVPALATSWQASADGKTITFTLRKDVKFHDASVFDADTAAASIRRVAKELTGAPYQSQFADVTRIEAKDGKLEIETAFPMQELLLRNLSMFAASIVSKDVLLASSQTPDIGAQNNYIREHPVGTGPFKVDSYSKDGVVVLSAFADYWNGAPKIKTLVFRQSAEATVRLERFKGGELVVVDDVERAEWAGLKDELHAWWALNCCYLGINTQKSGSALANFKIRQAIQLALDHDAIADLYLGTAKPNFTLLPPTFPTTDKEYRPAGSEKALAERLTMAKQLVTESGLSGAALKISLKRPKDPRPYLPKPAETAEKIKQQLAEIGLTVEPEAVPNGTLFGSISEGNHELVLIGWMSDNGDPDNFFGPLTGATMRDGALMGNENNVGRTADPSVVEAIQRAKTLDSAARIAAYRALEADQQARLIGYVPLVHTQQGIAVPAKISGVEIDGLGHYRFHSASINE